MLKRPLEKNITSKCFQLICMIILCSDKRHKARLSHVNIFLRHYGGQLKTAVEQDAGEKIACKI